MNSFRNNILALWDQIIIDEVEVWIFPHSAIELDPLFLAQMRSILTEDELQRLASLKLKSDQLQYLYGRSGLRCILGQYINLAPPKIKISYGAYGKPRVAQHDLNFNLAHSGSCILIAVSRRFLVGIDVENLQRKVDHHKLAQRFYLPVEYEALQKLPPDLQRLGFFTAWTSKEALSKALGLGLFYGLGHFQVSVDPWQPAQLIAAAAESELPACSITSFSPRRDYVAALAVLPG